MASGDKARLAGSALKLDSISESEAPDNSVFFDLTTGELKSKQGAAPPAPVGSVTSETLFLKTKKSSHASIISANTPVALKSDGTIVPTDSDSPDGQKFIGFARVDISPDSFGLVGLIAPNYTGTLVGKGFTSGEEVFIGEESGQLVRGADTSSFTGDDDSIIKIGTADCATEDANSVATDLIAFSEVVVRP